jgi:hypothetical protein
MDANSRRLYELGAADLAERFDAALGLVRDPFLPERHSPHHSLWFATTLIEAGETVRAEEIVERVLEMQERREDDPHRGNWRWHYEDECVIDLNACQFVLEALIAMPLGKFSSVLRERVFESIRLAFREAERLDVHWTYTNIYLLDVHNRILGGELIGHDAVVTAGVERFRAWSKRTREVGAPHEFNSPTYAAVQLNCLADIGSRARDADVRALAVEMEELVWRHIAAYWHAPTMQLGGPHSRAYRRDVVGASGFLKGVLYKLLGDERLLATTPYYEGPDAEGHVMVSRIEYHCPEDVRQMLQAQSTRESVEVVAHEPRTETRALVTPAFTLGTLSRPYGVGEPPEHWPMDTACIAYWRKGGALATEAGKPRLRGGDEAEYGVVYSRYRINAGRVGEQSRRERSWHDIWEDGTFRTAQDGGCAIVAYGMTPRGQRPLSSLRMDVRMLGVPAEDLREEGGRFWFVSGDVFVGIVPLMPDNPWHSEPVIVWRDADETVISIVNYEGPPKVFWEYRSLGGPFWKRNVRNGFAIWMAEAEDRCAARFAEMKLTDEMDGSRRRITFGHVALEYDLREMWP